MQHLPTDHLRHSKPKVYQEIDLAQIFGSLLRYQHRGCHIQKLNEGHQMGVEKLHRSLHAKNSCDYCIAILSRYVQCRF